MHWTSSVSRFLSPFSLRSVSRQSSMATLQWPRSSHLLCADSIFWPHLCVRHSFVLRCACVYMCVWRELAMIWPMCRWMADSVPVSLSLFILFATFFSLFSAFSLRLCSVCVCVFRLYSTSHISPSLYPFFNVVCGVNIVRSSIPFTSYSLACAQYLSGSSLRGADPPLVHQRMSCVQYSV